MLFKGSLGNLFFSLKMWKWLRELKECVFYRKETILKCTCCKTPHRTIFISNYKNIITRVYLKMIVAKEEIFRCPLKWCKKGSKGSMILLGLLPYIQSLDQIFTVYILSSILTTGTLLFSSGSLLYKQFLTCFSMFTNTIKRTLSTQKNFWNILLLLVGEYLAFLIHQCFTRTVLRVRLELLLCLF